MGEARARKRAGTWRNGLDGVLGRSRRLGNVCMMMKVLQCCRWFDGGESVEGIDWWDDMRIAAQTCSTHGIS